MANIETPRLVKKPGGVYMRVENQVELDAALADGWMLRLPAPTGIVLTDAPVNSVADDVSMEASDISDPLDASEPETEIPAKRGPGRPKKIV